VTDRGIDTLSLHPDSERVPMATADDLATLRASLAEFGQQDPIDITPDGLILDGRTRWTLLRELDAQSIQARVVDVPAAQQTHYIVDRALSRRHLTADQKRALNVLIREMTVEVTTNAKTGEEVRIGKGPTQRAATLGVGRMTVNKWDRDDRAGVPNGTPASAPTHYRDTVQRVLPLHPNRKPAAETPVGDKPTRLAIPRPKRNGPPWLRHFTPWCRAVLPEDRKYLLAMSEEIHKALGLLGLSCGHTEGDN